MSTDTKKHEVEQLTNLSVVYLRQCLNNSRWASTMDDYIQACDVLRSLPKIVIPTEIVKLNSDEETLKWGSGICIPLWEITDADRDIIRKALKHAFGEKYLPINEHAVDLITKFSLKS